MIRIVMGSQWDVSLGHGEEKGGCGPEGRTQEATHEGEGKTSGGRLQEIDGKVSRLLHQDRLFRNQKLRAGGKCERALRSDSEIGSSRIAPPPHAQGREDFLFRPSGLTGRTVKPTSLRLLPTTPLLKTSAPGSLKLKQSFSGATLRPSPLSATLWILLGTILRGALAPSQSLPKRLAGAFVTLPQYFFSAHCIRAGAGIHYPKVPRKLLEHHHASWGCPIWPHRDRYILT